jgi:hypothetical protein
MSSRRFTGELVVFVGCVVGLGSKSSKLPSPPSETPVVEALVSSAAWLSFKSFFFSFFFFFLSSSLSESSLDFPPPIPANRALAFSSFLVSVFGGATSFAPNLGTPPDGLLRLS